MKPLTSIGNPMHQMVKTTVAALITRAGPDGEQILLTRRNVSPFRDCWCLPGGHIDRFETARDAVIREVKEETGLDFSPRFLDWFDEIFPEADFHAVVLAFAGTAAGELAPQPEEVTETCWIAPAEALARPLAFRHHDIIAAYLQQRSAA